MRLERIGEIIPCGLGVRIFPSAASEIVLHARYWGSCVFPFCATATLAPPPARCFISPLSLFRSTLLPLFSLGLSSAGLVILIRRFQLTPHTFKLNLVSAELGQNLIALCSARPRPDFYFICAVDWEAFTNPSRSQCAVKWRKISTYRSRKKWQRNFIFGYQYSTMVKISFSVRLIWEIN
jgi:hypothetical protein